MKKGFSLTEILVSIAIIGILSGIGIQAFVASRQRARLEEDVAKVVQALRKAQNAALAPSRSEAAGIATDSTLCAIGVKIDQTNRTIQLIYQTGTTSCSGENNYGTTATELNYASIDTSSDIVFDVPFAKTSEKIVKLKLDDLEKTITVTNSGLIKVDNN